MTEKRLRAGRRIIPYLAVLLALFLFRVLAQLTQAVYELPILPPFDRWQGGVMPYPVLLTSQILIVTAMSILTWRVRAGRLKPGRWRHRICFVFGSIYAAVMAFRLVAGLTFLSHVPWFTVFLPSIFHLVLASFVLLLGAYFYQTRL